MADKEPTAMGCVCALAVQTRWSKLRAYTPEAATVSRVCVVPLWTAWVYLRHPWLFTSCAFKS